MTARRTAVRNRVALPDDFAPQLALAAQSAPEGDEWVHELKYDGYRIGARAADGNVRLLSRRGNDWTSRFPTIRDAVAELGRHRLLLDGEVAVLRPDGSTSFQDLQNASRGTAAARQLVYFVFDLLHLDGEDITPLPLIERKRRLQDLLRGAPEALRYSDHVIGNGSAVLDHACRLGLEGIVSKRAQGRYEVGRRGGWLKIKCIRRQELVIGGFTEPQGSRAGLGALLVGVYEPDGKLRFAGKVGTGFTQAGARDLRQRLDDMEGDTCPFQPRPPAAIERRAHWVLPHLVAEVAFSEWTSDGKIRHPSFQGLREDKSAGEVAREVPLPTAQAVRAQPRAAARSPAGRGHQPEVVAGIALTHPERILWPAISFRKLDLARLYEQIADWMLPHLRGRPLTLVRCPDGIGESCFYMKHSPQWAAPSLKRVRIPEQRKRGEYLVADSVEALVGLVQMSVTEIHTWNSTVEHLEEPDRIVLDLDPGPEVRWPQIVAAARLLRQALKELKLESFVKTTGGSGLHVVVPLEPRSTWARSLDFARRFAEAIVAHEPGLYTTAFARAGREQKILIDYLRNNRTNTSVAAFSTRATEKAPMSVPLAWDELSPRLHSDHYNVANLPARLRSLRQDPWAAYWRCRQTLPGSEQSGR